MRSNVTPPSEEQEQAVERDDSWVSLGNWEEVAAGLRLFMAYAITNVSFTVIVLVATIAVAAQGDYEAIATLVAIAKIGAVVGVAIAVFGLAAVWRYAQVPQQTGARGPALAAFWLGVASLVLSLVSVIGMFGMDFERMAEGNGWDLIAKILGAVQFFFLVGSMRITAGYIGRLDLHQLAGTTMLLAGVTVALVVFSQIMAATGVVALTALLGLGVLGIGIWCFVYLLILVSRLGRAVSADVQLPTTFS